NVYFMKNKYSVNRAMINIEREGLDKKQIYICNRCKVIFTDSENEKLESLVNCPACNEKIQLDSYKYAIRFPNMSSKVKARITCDEENRQIQGYEISINYKKLHDKVEKSMVSCAIKEKFAIITYEHNGKIIIVNKGIIYKNKKTLEREVQSFNFCTACGEWLRASKVDDHNNRCIKSGTSKHIFKDLWLFIEGNHDVLTFKFPLIKEKDFNDNKISSYYITLKEAIIQSILLTYNLEESEIEGFIQESANDEGEKIIVIFETEDGGTGVLKSLINPELNRFETFIENLKKILHIENLEPYKETRDACLEACYNCLLTFRNQRFHQYINRKLIIPLVKKLKNCRISTFTQTDQIETNIDDKLQYLKAKCDSELEKMVLEEIKRQNLPLPDDAQVVFFDDCIPIAKADLFYNKETFKIYVFIDGPPHRDEDNKTQDRKKRSIIEDKYGSIVVALDFTDGDYKRDKNKITKEVEKLKEFLN
ncbi:MAG: DUF1998 domain-containing protein, partial [Promethearchaeota archaeon]